MYKYVQQHFGITFHIFLRGRTPSIYKVMFQDDEYSRDIMESFQINDWKKLNPKDYDIVECAESQYLHSLYGKLLSRLSNKPFAIRIYENITRYRRIPFTLSEHFLTKSRFFMKLVERGSYIIASTNNAKYDLVYRGIPESKISVVYPGVNIRKFAFKDHINYNKLVYVGRPLREKGIDILRKAEKELGYRLNVVSSKKYGSVEEAYTGIFCMLSEPLLTWEEQFCFSLVQAMLSGCICIVSNSGALPEVVGPYGHVTPFHDYERFVETLDLIKSKSWKEKEEERRKIAEYARRKYSLESFGSKMTEIYKQLCAGSAA